MTLTAVTQKVHWNSSSIVTLWKSKLLSASLRQAPPFSSASWRSFVAPCTLPDVRVSEAGRQAGGQDSVRLRREAWKHA